MRGSRPSRRRALVLTLAASVALGCLVAGVAVAAISVACPGCTDDPARPVSAPAVTSPEVAAAVERLGGPFPASVDAQAVVDEVERRHGLAPAPLLQWGSPEEELSVRWRSAWEVEALAAEADGDGPRLGSAIDHLDLAQQAQPDPAWFAEIIAPARDGLVSPLVRHVETACPSPVG